MELRGWLETNLRIPKRNHWCHKFVVLLLAMCAGTVTACTEPATKVNKQQDSVQILLEFVDAVVLSQSEEIESRIAETSALLRHLHPKLTNSNIGEIDPLVRRCVLRGYTDRATNAARVLMQAIGQSDIDAVTDALRKGTDVRLVVDRIGRDDARKFVQIMNSQVTRYDGFTTQYFVDRVVDVLNSGNIDVKSRRDCGAE